MSDYVLIKKSRGIVYYVWKTTFNTLFCKFILCPECMYSAVCWCEMFTYISGLCYLPIFKYVGNALCLYL